MSTSNPNGYLMNALGEIVIMASGRFVTVPPDHRKHGAIRQALAQGSYDAALDLADQHAAVARFFTATGIQRGKAGSAQLELTVDNYGRTLFMGDVLPTEVAELAVKLLDAKLKPTPLLRFLERLQGCPSQRVREQLLGFVSRNTLLIDSDGLLVAYKTVRDDFNDIWSGNVSYQPGTIVTMPRELVDADPDQQCSRGLHFATWTFAWNFGHSHPGSRMIELRVDPKHVVSVPYAAKDKGRAHTLRSHREVENYREVYSPSTPPVRSDMIWPSAQLAEEDESYDDLADVDGFVDFGTHYPY